MTTTIVIMIDGLDPEYLESCPAPRLEEMAREWIAPAPLGEAPTDGPKDLWFFRMDPRPAA